MPKRETRAWGYVYEYFSKRNFFTVSTEHILPGHKIALHYHKISREIEVVLRGFLVINGRQRRPGEVFVWEPGMQHEHDNSQGTDEAIVLTLSLPHFEFEDEIYVSETDES